MFLKGGGSCDKCGGKILQGDAAELRNAPQRFQKDQQNIKGGSTIKIAEINAGGNQIGKGAQEGCVHLGIVSHPLYGMC